jgi:hypothetical protein
MLWFFAYNVLRVFAILATILGVWLGLGTYFTVSWDHGWQWGTAASVAVLACCAAVATALYVASNRLLKRARGLYWE